MHGPTPTPTKTPKPTFTGTATATETPAMTNTPTVTSTPADTPTPLPTETPLVTNTPKPTDTPVPTNTPVRPPTATPVPLPPTATFTPAPTATPTPLPVQYSGSLIWDAASANCFEYSIRKDSMITDASGAPVNGECVCLTLYSNLLKSNPSGPGSYYEAGHYDLANFAMGHQEDMTGTAFVCDCATGAAKNSDYVTIDWSYANCAPNSGGHQAAVVNWRKNW